MNTLINCTDIANVPVGVDLVIIGRYNRTGKLEDKQAFIGMLTHQPNSVDGNLSAVYMQYCGSDQLVECEEVNKNPGGYYCSPLYSALINPNQIPAKKVENNLKPINESEEIDSGEPQSHGYINQD